MSKNSRKLSKLPRSSIPSLRKVRLRISNTLQLLRTKKSNPILLMIPTRIKPLMLRVMIIRMNE